MNARNTDPRTSHDAAHYAARKSKSIRHRMAALIQDAYVAGQATAGWTGKELAELTGAALNSVTPRLAELRRAGFIKDSGHRSDGQIVWVHANDNPEAA